MINLLDWAEEYGRTYGHAPSMDEVEAQVNFREPGGVGRLLQALQVAAFRAAHPAPVLAVVAPQAPRITVEKALTAFDGMCFLDEDETLYVVSDADLRSILAGLLE